MIDDGPNLASLMNAAQLLEKELSYDERSRSESISQSINQSNETGFYHYSSNRLTLTQQMRLPQSILDQYQSIECMSLHGFLGLIDRAYLSIDSKLLLWNYENGSEFYSYQSLNQQIVLNVANVRPKAGIFPSNVHSLLIVTTPTDIQVLAVTFSQSNNQSNQSSLSLLPTDYTVSTDNVPMIAATSSSNGRIFTGGSDGNIYELDYQLSASWNRPKARLVNQSSGFNPWNAVKSMVWSSSNDPIQSMIIDETRQPNVLYTLSEKSVIAAYSIGSKQSNDTTFQCLSVNQSIYQEAKNLLFNLHPNYTEDWNSASEFKLINISIIPSHESDRVTLQAVTSHGHRLMLSLYEPRPAYMNSQQQQAQLKVKAVRLSPPGASAPVTDQRPLRNQPVNQLTPFDPAFRRGSSPCFVHSAYYRDGVLLLADSIPQGGDTIVGCLRDDEASTNKLVETVDSTAIPSKIADFTESSPLRGASPLADTLFARGQSKPLVGLHEFTLQHVVPARSFMLLSPNGMYVFTKQRPLDDLRAAVQRRKQTLDDSEINALFTRYGFKEAGAMLMVLACGSPAVLALTDGNETGSASLGSPNKMPFLDDGVIKQARQVFIRLAVAVASQQPSLQLMPAAPMINRSINQSNVNLTPAVSSLLLFASRLFRPLWNWPIMIRCSPSRNDMCLRYTRAQLTEMSGWIDRLASFIEEHAHVFASTDADRAVLNDLQAMNSLTLELLSFMHLLSLHHANFLINLLSLLDDADVAKLGSSQFYQFTTSRDDFELLKRLMAAVTRLPLLTSGTGVGAADGRYESEQWVMRLHKACPTFFAASDLLYYQANEAIKRAQSLGGVQRQAMVDEATRHYQLAARATSFSVQQVAEALCKAAAFQAVVDVVLTRLELLERGEVAPPRNPSVSQPVNQSLRQSRSDEQAHEQFIANEKQCCYGVILQLLDMLHPSNFAEMDPDIKQSISECGIDPSVARTRVLQACLSSDSRTLHSVIYQKLIDGNEKESLFSVRTPYLVEFLSTSGEELLLKDYLLRANLHGPAAVLLLKLAETPGQQFGLSDRLGFLARSLACARAALEQQSILTGDANQDSEWIHELRASIELAKIQSMLLEHVRSMPNSDVALVQLESELASASTLADLALQFCAPHVTLALVAATQIKPSDPQAIPACWKNIINGTIIKARENNASWPQAVVERLVELCGLYSNVPDLFPLDSIIHSLECAVALCGVDTQDACLIDSNARSAVEISDASTPAFWLIHCNVAAARLIAAYDHLLDLLSPELEKPVLRSITYLLDHAAHYQGNPSGSQLFSFARAANEQQVLKQSAAQLCSKIVMSLPHLLCAKEFQSRWMKLEQALGTAES